MHDVIVLEVVRKRERDACGRPKHGRCAGNADRRVGGSARIAAQKLSSGCRSLLWSSASRVPPLRHVSIRNSTKDVSSRGNHPPSNSLAQFEEDCRKIGGRNSFRYFDAFGGPPNPSLIQSAARPVLAGIQDKTASLTKTMALSA